MLIPAYSLKYLTDINHAKTNVKAENCNTRKITYKKRNKALASFLTKSNERNSSKAGHIQNILFLDYKPGKLLVTHDCLVFCSCPAFKWWGTQYNATALGYNMGEAMDIAPDKRDPNTERLLCKHLVAVTMKLTKSNLKTASSLESIDFYDDEVQEVIGFSADTDAEFEKLMLDSIKKGRL